jgi:hypothetical protein
VGSGAKAAAPRAVTSEFAGLRLAVYFDAEARGGAEVNLSHLIGALPDGIDVTLVESSEAVVTRSFAG